MAGKPEPQSVVRVGVIVTENGKLVAEHDLAYFIRQPYTVSLTTPDGTDWTTGERVAGADGEATE